MIDYRLENSSVIGQVLTSAGKQDSSLNTALRKARTFGSKHHIETLITTQTNPESQDYNVTVV
ncbi:hypothetical protein C0J52_12958 [Blattella germanica]|nr:hypothetical protein C0J52_12958 [Blattella germanica]